MRELFKDFIDDLKDGDPLSWAIVGCVTVLVALVLAALYLFPEDASDEYLTHLLVAFVVGWLIAGRRSP